MPSRFPGSAAQTSTSTRPGPWGADPRRAAFTCPAAPRPARAAHGTKRRSHRAQPRAAGPTLAPPGRPHKAPHFRPGARPAPATHRAARGGLGLGHRRTPARAGSTVGRHERRARRRPLPGRAESLTRLPAATRAPRSRLSARPGPRLRSPRSRRRCATAGRRPHFRPRARQDGARDAACAAPRGARTRGC